MKTAIIEIVRRVHLTFSPTHYPRRVALIFHELLERQWPAFREAIGALRDEGFETVSPVEYCKPHSAQDRSLLITFDDNFNHWYRALPLFDELDLKAVFYVNSGPFRDLASHRQIEDFFDRINHHEGRISLSQAELKTIREFGHTIGCHTSWHHNLRGLPRRNWSDAIEVSRDAIQNLLGEAVVDFSYPYGMRRFFSEPLRNYCRSLGFERIAEGRPGRLHAPDVNPHAIQRTRWNLDSPLKRNLEDIRIDGRVYENLTGRSAIG